ncbi:MAG: GNAT family N-acetyltransferase [Vicinamibacterales bacterium]
MRLVWPSREHLPSYVAALRRGWSPDNMRAEAGREELDRIAADADGFVATLVDREARGPAVTLPDGSTVPRLPGYHRWMWDGEFCGGISLRWQSGTESLPPYCLGHIGYAVVPWKQRRGYATQALREILEDAGAEGLRYVEITTSPDNVPSRRVIERNGGVLVEEFAAPATSGGTRKLRYRVQIAVLPTPGRNDRAKSE